MCLLSSIFNMLPPVLHISPRLSLFSLASVAFIKIKPLATVPTSQRMKFLVVNDTQTQKIKYASQSCMGPVAASLLTLALVSRS